MTEKFINILKGAERLAKLTDVDKVMQDLSRLLKKTVN